MPFTPEQIAKIRQKEAALPDAHRRDPLNKYTEGWFHVTLSVRGEAPVLGIIMGNADAPDGTADAPRCVLTELGRKVEEAWNACPSFYPGIEIIAFQIMPDHVHGLVHLTHENEKHLGQIIKGFMIGSSHGYWDTLGIDWRSMTYVKGVRTPQYNDRDHTRSFRGPALFVRGYNDVEAMTEEEIEIKRQYIHNNPRKRLIQGSNYRCFRKHRHAHSRNWTVERVMAAIANDRGFSYDSIRREKAMLNILERLNKDGEQIGLDYIGNDALLAASRKLPLVCHRADVALFEQQKAAVLKAAREGAIIVSAFISQKERDIKQQLMVEQLPFVEIIDNGIAEKYKGIGKAFYALAENRLCQITPWSYLYQKDVTVSREMCLVMNELARIVSGVCDDWWKRNS